MGLLRRLIRRLPGRRRAFVTIDGDEHVLLPAAGVAVYETQGRIVLRPIDSCDGIRYERDENHVVDGFPDLDPATLGARIVELVSTTREVTRPERWPKLSEYAAPLVAAAPTRHRSYRSWQRVTRHVSVRFDDGVVCDRWRADLGRGSWMPGDEGSGVPNTIELGPTTTGVAIGEAVLRLLAAPPIAG